MGEVGVDSGGSGIRDEAPDGAVSELRVSTSWRVLAMVIGEAACVQRLQVGRRAPQQHTRSS